MYSHRVVLFTPPCDVHNAVAYADEIKKNVDDIEDRVASLSAFYE